MLLSCAFALGGRVTHHRNASVITLCEIRSMIWRVHMSILRDSVTNVKGELRVPVTICERRLTSLTEYRYHASHEN